MNEMTKLKATISELKRQVESETEKALINQQNAFTTTMELSEVKLKVDVFQKNLSSSGGFYFF